MTPLCLQKVDYEMLWEIEAANKTIDRKKTKKTTGYQVAMPLTSFSPSTDFSDSVKKDDNEPSTFVVRKEGGELVSEQVKYIWMYITQKKREADNQTSS